jgi:hypothetical protein
MKTFSQLWKYIFEFSLEWEMFQIKFVEETKTYILSSVLFSESSFFYEIMSKLWWKKTADTCALHAG